MEWPITDSLKGSNLWVRTTLGLNDIIDYVAFFGGEEKLIFNNLSDNLLEQMLKIKVKI